MALFPSGSNYKGGGMNIIYFLSIVVLMLVLFLVGLGMFFDKQEKGWINQPCSAYANTTLKNVPFRCVPGLEVK